MPVERRHAHSQKGFKQVKKIKARRLGVGAAVTVVTLTLLPAVAAHADSAPQAGDVVGVGSDLIQYALDFGADGSTDAAGYNSAGNVNRLISFDATADSNGRSGYLNGSTFSSQLPLNPTIVLRAGTNPVLRPNGGTTGVAAFLADTAGEINFVRSPRVPTSAEQGQATSHGWGGIHVVQIGTDNLRIATATTTNAPSGLSAAELVGIYNGTYKHWNELPGNSGGSTDTIIPLIPQNGAAVRTLFTNDLKVANGGTAVTLVSGIINVEQNDPTVIAGQSNPADAIVPIPVGRIALYTDAYFKDPSKAYGTPQTTLSSNVKLLTAAAGDSAASYNGVAPYYIWFRQTDAVSTTPWQPGSTKNWVQTLFSSSTGTPYFKGPIGQALVADAGATPGYQDLGITSVG
jgi:ABC-type phosphate transport system substrate-binding protein